MIAKLTKPSIEEIGIHEEGKRYYIHGFCIDPAFQGRGLGMFSLAQTVNLCLKRDEEKQIELEVQVDNIQALGLYKRTGFSILTEFRYYRTTPTQGASSEQPHSEHELPNRPMSKG